MGTLRTTRIGAAASQNSTKRITATASGGQTVRVTGPISAGDTIRTDVPDPLLTENNFVIGPEVGSDYLELE
jgi:hypothetical protein